MSLYTIADLHLPGAEGSRKAMDVFDPRWTDAKSKLEKKWISLVRDTDSVILPGDFSWALRLEDTLEDFRFLNSLPGTKYIGKGNHDFWWTTARNMNSFFENYKLNSIKLLYNNSYVIGNTAVIGARGWFPDPENQKTVGEVDWNKMISREEIRLKLSIDSLPKDAENKEKILFIHFPPVWKGFECRGILDMMHNAGIKRCYYGHIHGYYMSDADFVFEDIKFEMISADHLDFAPKPVFGT